MKPRDEGVYIFVTSLLKKTKTLTEREVKTALARRLGGKAVNARVIRDVRKQLRIDRPRAIAWARKMLARTPRLEARKVIAEVSERFGIRLGPPDVTRLRPAAARRKRTSKGQPGDAAAKHRRAANAVHVTYQANGHPDDIALFFRTLAD